MPPGSRYSRVAALVMWLLLTPSVTTAAQPVPQPEVRVRIDTLYQEAMAHRAAQRWLQAAEAFDAAHRLEPSVVLLYNAGRMYDLGGKLERARERYRQFLAEERSPGERRQDVVKLLADVERRIAKEEARQQAARILEQQRASRASREHNDRLRTAGWGTLAVGAASVAAAIGLGIHTEVLAADIRDPDRDAGGIVVSLTEAELAERFDDANATLVASIATASVGAVLMITGALLVQFGEESDDVGKPSVRAAPLIGRGAAGLMLVAEMPLR